MFFSFCLSIIYFINRNYFLNQDYKGNHFFSLQKNECIELYIRVIKSKTQLQYATD